MGVKGMNAFSALCEKSLQAMTVWKPPTPTVFWETSVKSLLTH